MIAACAGEAAPPGEFVGRLCHLGPRLLPVDGASVSLLAEGAARQLLCSTDDTAAQLCEAQLSLGSGPGLHAFAEGSPVLVADLGRASDAERWPMFAHRALELETAALFAFPLSVGAIAVGTMDLYRRRPGPLAEPEIGAALLLADAVTLGVLRLYATGGEAEYERGEGELSSWLPGQADYDEVHQATGMVMVQCGVGPEEALLRLRARAFAVGMDLTGLSREVVSRRVRLDEDE
ncbi:GAF and ANTAR domain-containing protein [Actinospica robiniae]|uniref:GAF and ANTAR domain-containing protein n=1 Tax=Actinospica robiniae TaxID=304901 RepID=UPI000405AFB2|nr:GAF and ANTAR domain-containing protein [Actinospica robiniae]